MNSSLKSSQTDSTLKTWKPLNARQREALSRSEFEVGIGGERGGGKSEVGRVWLLEPEYVNHPMYRCLVLRKNSIDLADWIFRLKAFCGSAIEIGGNPPTIKFPGGGLGTLGHLANKDSWSHYVGHEYQKVLVEELNLIPEEQQYLMVLGSCRSSVPELTPQVLSSFNPGNVGHFWVKKRFVDVADGRTYIDPKSGLSRIFIRLKLRENVKLPKEYEQTLRLLPVAIQKAWLDGDWDALAGLFFVQMPPKVVPTRKEAIHQKLYGSFDFGSSETGHSSFGFWDIGGPKPVRMGTWYHKLGKTAGEQAYELKEWVKTFPYTHGQMPKAVFSDPAIFTKNKVQAMGEQPRSVSDYFKDAGFNMVPAYNHRANGWVITQDYFGCDPLTREPKMEVWEGYNETFYECFAMQVRNPDNPLDIADNNFDHVCDECRYGLVEFHNMSGAKSVDEKIRETLVSAGPSAVDIYRDLERAGKLQGQIL